MNYFASLPRYGLSSLLALLLCLLAFDSRAERPSSAMLDAMQAMVDSMSDYVADRRGSGTGLGEMIDRRFGFGDEYEDLRILFRDMPGAPPRSSASRTRLLDGVWMGRNRSILMIRDGYLRAFAYSLAHFEDAEIYLDPPLLQIRNLDTGILREFEFVYRGGKLAMRDDNGQLLFYRRLNLDDPDRTRYRR